MMKDVVASEFLWGLVLGVLLSTLTAFIIAKIAQSYQKRMIRRLCADLVSNIGLTIDELVKDRSRTNVISHEFIDLIAAEVQIYGRTREHFSLIDDANLRKEIREFFSEAATRTVRIKTQLEIMSTNLRALTNAQTPQERQTFEAAAQHALTEARRICDDLIGLRPKVDPLVGRLST